MNSLGLQDSLLHLQPGVTEYICCWVDVDQPDDCFVHLVLCCIAVKVSSCFVCHDNAQMLACQQHLLELDNVHMAEASLQLDLTPDLLRAKTQVFAPAYDE